MKRLHVNLKVKALDDSIRFYSTLFGTEPTLTKTDYAKWMLDDPRVNFSIVATAGSAAAHGIEHLGIQAETEAELAELRERIGTMQGEVFDEGETVCCYHTSDKTWIRDAQGVAWETFYTSGEADAMHSPAPAAKADSDCCDETCCT